LFFAARSPGRINLRENQFDFKEKIDLQAIGHGQAVIGPHQKKPEKMALRQERSLIGLRTTRL
jgi:hypothetical protein